jgi:hypothetical protein
VILVVESCHLDHTLITSAIRNLSGMSKSILDGLSKSVNENVCFVMDNNFSVLDQKLHFSGEFSELFHGHHSLSRFGNADFLSKCDGFSEESSELLVENILGAGFRSLDFVLFDEFLESSNERFVLSDWNDSSVFR